MSKTTTENPTRVTIGPVRLSYLSVWEPKEEEGKEPKYKASLIIQKKDKQSVEAVKAAVNAAKEDGKTSKWGGKIPATLKLPLRDGDEERDDDPAYANAYFVNTSSNKQPGIVDRKLKKILDHDEVYSGCYAFVSLNFFPFNNEGNKGVGVALNHIMKVKDGEPLAGGISAEDAFAGVSFDEEDSDDNLGF